MEATYNVVRLPLEKIDLNPYQMRHTIVHANSIDFDKSIVNVGLREPISVRAVGGRYQIIDGQLRFGAFCRLHEQATDEATRARFASIPAFVHENVDDGEMLQIALVHNLQRHELTPLEIGDSLLKLKKLEPALGSVRQLAEATGLTLGTVGRCINLAEAPPFIRESLAEPPPDPDAEDPLPALTVSTALELVRCYNGLAQLPIPNAAHFAENKVTSLLRKVREGVWSLSRVRNHVDRLLSGKLATDSRRKAPVKPPFSSDSAAGKAAGPANHALIELLSIIDRFSRGAGSYAALIIHFVVSLFFLVRSKAMVLMRWLTKPAQPGVSDVSTGGSAPKTDDQGPERKAA